MYRVFRLAAAALVVACIGLMPKSQAESLPDSQKELIAMEHRWIDATIKGDADAFASFMADQYVAVVSNARIRDKATWVEGVRSGGLKYESVELRNLKVRLYGDTAIVTGEYTQKATSNGQDYSARGAYVTTWLKRNDRWQAIASGFSRSTTP
jgi:ketosteroid isomerase-like protein